MCTFAQRHSYHPLVTQLDKRKLLIFLLSSSSVYPCPCAFSQPSRLPPSSADYLEWLVYAGQSSSGYTGLSPPQLLDDAPARRFLSSHPRGTSRCMSRDFSRPRQGCQTNTCFLASTHDTQHAPSRPIPAAWGGNLCWFVNSLQKSSTGCRFCMRCLI